MVNCSVMGKSVIVADDMFMVKGDCTAREYHMTVDGGIMLDLKKMTPFIKEVVDCELLAHKGF